jgi:hypothetical protein
MNLRITVLLDLLGRRHDQKLVTVTHSYKNRSQTKTIFDLAKTVETTTPRLTWLIF